MEVSRIVAEIDAQIAKLQQARALLSETATVAATVAPIKGRRGRPKGSKNASSAAAPAAPAPTKRKLSPQGRKAIADAMRKRWAERKKVAAKSA